MVGRWFLDNALFRGIVWNLESLNKCYSVGVQNSEFRYVLVLVRGLRLNLCSERGPMGSKASPSKHRQWPRLPHQTRVQTPWRVRHLHLRSFTPKSLCSAVQNEPPPVLFSCSFTTHQTHDAFSTLTDTFEQPPAPPQFLFVSFRSLPNTPILPRSIGNIQHIEHWVGS